MIRESRIKQAHPLAAVVPTSQTTPGERKCFYSFSLYLSRLPVQWLPSSHSTQSESCFWGGGGGGGWTPDTAQRSWSLLWQNPVSPPSIWPGEATNMFVKVDTYKRKSVFPLAKQTPSVHRQLGHHPHPYLNARCCCTAMATAKTPTATKNRGPSTIIRLWESVSLINWYM